MKALIRHRDGLEALERRGRARRLNPRQGLDFASNDYLGLAGSDLLRDAARDALARHVPLGAGGSRLLRGNHDEHQALESKAAEFFGTKATLFMGGGFQANTALFSTLPMAGDLILHDALIHASAHDGMRLGRADTRAFAHNVVTDARDVAQDWRAKGGTGQIWLAVESVYSMEGDLAPLADLSDLAAELDAILVVDEAHATGVFGTHGRGLAHGEITAKAPEILTLHTCGKGLGVSGALICGAQALIDTLINRARPFIFATAPAPFDAALIRGAIEALERDSALTQSAQTRIDHAHVMAAQHCGLDGFHSQIMPVIVGADVATMDQAAALQDLGFDVRGIRPPTVPRGTSRLRISITGNVGLDDIQSLFQSLAQIKRPPA